MTATTGGNEVPPLIDESYGTSDLTRSYGLPTGDVLQVRVHFDDYAPRPGREPKSLPPTAAGPRCSPIHPTTGTRRPSRRAWPPHGSAAAPGKVADRCSPAWLTGWPCGRTPCWRPCLSSRETSWGGEADDPIPAGLPRWRWTWRYLVYGLHLPRFSHADGSAMCQVPSLFGGY
jgi:hypothetical protein